jgi:uncharacterized protein YjeT (DUF2065 family)
MIILSSVMIINPAVWADGIVKFSEKSWFHPFEIISRFAFGLAFVFFAEQTLYPKLIKVIGFGLILVSIGLLFTPPSKHRQFALWSAQKFRNKFRFFGFFSLLFGVVLIYTAVQK